MEFSFKYAAVPRFEPSILIASRAVGGAYNFPYMNIAFLIFVVHLPAHPGQQSAGVFDVRTMPLGGEEDLLLPHATNVFFLLNLVVFCMNFCLSDTQLHKFSTLFMIFSICNISG
jgi:hypothetical protein